MLKHHSPEKRKGINKKEALVLAFTGARLLIGAQMARNVLHHEPIVGAMALFLLADHFDGVLARKLGVDNPKRRITDALVDRASIAVNFAALATVNHDSWPFIGIMAAREAVVGLANGYVLKETGTVVQGSGIHKLSSLSIAAFGVVGAQYPEFTEAAGTVMVVVNSALAIDFIQNARHTKP